MPIDRTALADSLKLRGQLRALDAAVLKSIADFWKLKLPEEVLAAEGSQELADFLYPRLQAQQYFRPAFDRLSASDKDLVYFFAIHGGEMGAIEVATRAFRGNANSCRKSMESLQGKGFVFLSDDLPPGFIGDTFWASVPEAYLKLLELPSHWHGFTGGLLRELDNESLQAIAGRVLGEEPGSAVPLNVLRARIRRVLTDPDQLKAYLEQLNELERSLLQEMIDRRGFVLYRDMLDTTSPKKFDHTRAEQLNSLINSSGLVYTVSEGHNKYMNSLMVPRDVHYIITKKFQSDNRSLQKIDAVSGGSKDSHPTSVVDNSQALLRDLVIFAARVDVLRAKRLASGGISKTDLKKAVSVFPANKNQKYGALLATFLIEQGLLVHVNDEWRASESLTRSLQTAEKFYQELWRWWLRTSGWSELYLEGNPAITERPPQEPADILELRRAVLKEVSTAARDRWVTFESFWEAVAPRLEAQFVKPSTSGFTTNSLRDAVASIIGESLAWLGVVFYGTSTDRLPVTSSQVRARETKKQSRAKTAANSPIDLEFSFQLTPLGRNLLAAGVLDSTQSEIDAGRPATGYIAHGANWLIIQPNLEIVAPPDLALDAIFQLARFCEIKNMDVMTTMEITRESLRSCMERGTTGDEIVGFLAGLSRVELPQTVRQMVEECSTKHGEVRIGSAGGYIIADDPVVLESIRRNNKLNHAIKDVVGEKVMVLAQQTDLGKIAKELRTQGLMPHVETGTVHASSDGRYHLSLTGQELLDLIAAARLVRTVEETLNTDISEGSAAVLAQRLTPEALGFVGGDQGAEARSRSFQKKFEAAFQKVTDDINDKYKNQVSRLVSKSMSTRGASKYHYKGANPALERGDIEELLTFALEHDLEVELLYVKQNEQEARLRLMPKGVEGDRLHAYDTEKDSEGIYAIPRMLRAKLL